MGKAIANGFPLAAVGGRAEVMGGVGRTWISSTLATELVSLAAARATLGVMDVAQVPAHLGRVGGRLLAGFGALAAAAAGARDAAWPACRRCASSSSTTRRAGAAVARGRGPARAPLQAFGLQLRLPGARRAAIDRPLAGDRWTRRSTRCGA